MTDELSDADWDDLADLITEAPPQRIQLAMNCIGAASATASAWRNGVDRLLHLATISSGNAFDRALLHQLRRLSVH